MRCMTAAAERAARAPLIKRPRRFATAGVYNANVTYAGTQSFNNSGNIYPVLPSAGAFAATNVSTAIPTTFTPNQVVLQPSPRTSPTIVPPYYLVGDSLNAYATLTVAATGAPAPNVVVLFTDSAPLTGSGIMGYVRICHADRGGHRRAGAQRRRALHRQCAPHRFRV